MKAADFVNYYFEKELHPLMDEVFEDIMDQQFDTAKNKINKFIFKLQELRRHLHDNNE
tara:strand:+ start:7381 stop:7554 length:174 start_codon:yes stop_codon:yes gene_type:complete